MILHDHPGNHVLDDWKNAARRMHQKWREVENAKRKQRGVFKDLLFGSSNTNQNRGGQRPNRSQHVPMQVDTVTTTEINATRTRLTPKLRKRLRREGKCFYCREKGHTSFDCPELAKQKKAKQKQTQARVTEVAETSTKDDTETKPIDPCMGLAKKISNLTDDQRHNLFSAIEQGF